MIQLAKSHDGRLIVGSTHALPSDVRRVEYYREQKLFQLVYEDEEASEDLMPTEISDTIDRIVRASPDILVVVHAEGQGEPYGYEVPLIQIGI